MADDAEEARASRGGGEETGNWSKNQQQVIMIRILIWIRILIKIRILILIRIKTGIKPTPGDYNYDWDAQD